MFLRNVGELKPDMFLVAGGCSAFGHSCFGGHGKRADEGVLLLPGAVSDQQQRPMFPAAETGSDDAEDAMIQPEGYGALSPASSASLLPSPHRLSPFLRQWASISSGPSHHCHWHLLPRRTCAKPSVLWYSQGLGSPVFILSAYPSSTPGLCKPSQNSCF
jgi:hypothetical protein